VKWIVSERPRTGRRRVRRAGCLGRTSPETSTRLPERTLRWALRDGRGRSMPVAVTTYEYVTALRSWLPMVNPNEAGLPAPDAWGAWMSW